MITNLALVFLSASVIAFAIGILYANITIHDLHIELEETRKLLTDSDKAKLDALKLRLRELRKPTGRAKLIFASIRKRKIA